MRYRNISIFLSVALCLLASCQKEEKAFVPQSFDDLKGHTVCVLEGSIQQDYAMAHVKQGDVNFVFFPGATDCMLAVNQGKADVFFGADLYAYNEAFHRQNLKICHLTPECGGPIAFGVKKENMTLAGDMDTFEDSLNQCGQLKKIVSRWFNPDNTDFHDCVKIAPTEGKVSGKDKILKVGIAGVKPPAEVMIDNKWTGCEIELLQMYAKSRGMQLKIDVYDFDNLIPAVQSGKIDIVASTLAINPERQKKVTFIKPYNAVSAAFIIPDPEKQNVVSTWDKLKQSAYYSLVAEDRWQLLAGGLWTTVIIAFFSLLLGSILGGGVCWMRMNNRKPLVVTGKLYISIMRNMPMLVFLMLMFYVFLAKSGLPTILVAIIAFGMNSAAYICEIYRTGIEGVDKGQTEAGLALGFSPVQTFFYIIAPQAVHKALPVFKNETVTLLKGTSIVGYISIIDLTKASDLIRSASFEAFFPLLIISVAYFILAWLFTTVIDVLVKRI